MKKIAGIIICFLISGSAITGQETDPAGITPEKTGGFRVGVTYLSTFKNEDGRELATALAKEKINPMITQFGYQFEKVWPAGAGCNGAVSQVMLLAGGLEQGVCIPSVSWLVGVRVFDMLEMGGGPNLSLTKNKGGMLYIYPSFVWGIGGVVKAGKIRFPLDIALANNRGGLRTTVLTGFTFN